MLSALCSLLFAFCSSLLSALCCSLLFALCCLLCCLLSALCSRVRIEQTHRVVFSRLGNYLETVWKLWNCCAQHFVDTYYGCVHFVKYSILHLKKSCGILPSTDDDYFMVTTLVPDPFVALESGMSLMGSRFSKLAVANQYLVGYGLWSHQRCVSDTLYLAPRSFWP